MIRPPLTPLVDSLPSFVPFVGPEAQERGRGAPFRARIGANESSFGPSPKVIAAIAEAATAAAGIGADRLLLAVPETYLDRLRYRL